jgi:hypothetical protein
MATLRFASCALIAASFPGTGTYASEVAIPLDRALRFPCHRFKPIRYLIKLRHPLLIYAPLSSALRSVNNFDAQASFRPLSPIADAPAICARSANGRR